MNIAATYIVLKNEKRASFNKLALRFEFIKLLFEFG